jgi:hypothetical protein
MESSPLLAEILDQLGREGKACGKQPSPPGCSQVQPLSLRDRLGCGGRNSIRQGLCAVLTMGVGI